MQCELPSSYFSHIKMLPWLQQPQTLGYDWLCPWKVFNRRYEKLKVKQSLLSVKKEFNGHWLKDGNDMRGKRKLSTSNMQILLTFVKQTLTGGDFTWALVILNILLWSLVDSVQYLVYQRGTQLLPTAAAAFCLLQKKAEIVKKLSKTQDIRKQHLPLVITWII